MPRKCCVPGCRSNYKDEGEYTNVFSFPKNPELKSKWEKLIHRKDFVVTDYSVVCIKHFDERFIERNHHATRTDGTVSVDRMLMCDVAEEAKVYMSVLDRGGLLWPSNLTINICSTALKIFQTCISTSFEEQFVKLKNQRHFLCELSKEKLLYDGISCSGMCNCGKSHECLLFSCVKVMNNILLNNYIKHRNNSLKSKNNTQKKSHTTRKLDTFQK